MRVFIIDIEQMGLDFALRCAQAGDDVRLYRHMPKRKERYGEGFKEIALVDDWRASMAWAKDGLIVNTGNFTLLHELDRYREFGFNIFSPTAQSARLETDRGFGMEAMEALGIDLPPYETFNSMEEAEKFARKTTETFVFKVLDGAAEDKSLTYVSRDPADLVGWLQRKIAAGISVKKCMLQEKIKTDFEIGVNGWFGPAGFLPDKYQLSWEHKPLMSGDIGPNTGEMISVSQYVETDRLVDELLLPFSPILSALGHRGDFCVGAMIDASGKAYPLETTARCGFPAFFGQIASHKGSPSSWMKALLSGDDKLRVSYDVCMAAVLAQPNWPYKGTPEALAVGNPIHIDPVVMSNVHLVSVMKGRGPVMAVDKVTEGDTFQTTGEYVMVATALGKTIERTRTKLYQVIDGVHFPNMMYRDDAGEKVENAIKSMHQNSYAMELS